VPFFTLNLSPQGPLVNAMIGVSGERRKALQTAKQAIPAPQPIRALIDTGASGTCVDPSVLQALALTPTGIVTVNTPSTGPQPHSAEQFDVSLFIPGALLTTPPLTIQNLPVISAELLASQGFHALIGRDILSMCLLVVNGQIKNFSLSY